MPEFRPKWATKYSALNFFSFSFYFVKFLKNQKGLTEVKIPFPLSRIKFFEEKPLTVFPPAAAFVGAGGVGIKDLLDASSSS